MYYIFYSIVNRIMSWQIIHCYWGNFPLTSIKYLLQSFNTTDIHCTAFISGDEEQCWFPSVHFIFSPSPYAVLALPGLVQRLTKGGNSDSRLIRETIKSLLFNIRHRAQQQSNGEWCGKCAIIDGDIFSRFLCTVSWA